MGLRELRKRSNITLEQLSALTGYDMPRLSRYETVDDDVRNMFLGTAASLARILHCNVLDLYPDEHVWRGGVSAGVIGLRNIRLFRGLTQTQLAGMSGVARPNISWFETGYRPVSQMYLRTALRLSEALQCDPCWYARWHPESGLSIPTREQWDDFLEELKSKGVDY